MLSPLSGRTRIDKTIVVETETEMVDAADLGPAHDQVTVMVKETTSAGGSVCLAGVTAHPAPAETKTEMKTAGTTDT